VVLFCDHLDLIVAAASVLESFLLLAHVIINTNKVHGCLWVFSILRYGRSHSLAASKKSTTFDKFCRKTLESLRSFPLTPKFELYRIK
jgi:hypothetical protein